MTFFRREWRFLTFGLLLTFWGSPGQTFVISLFGGHIRTDFNLSHGEFGSLYTLATLASAVFLWGTGPLVDRLPLRHMSLAAVLAMVTATAAVSLVTGPISLLIAIFAVRFMGQGLMSHISMTAMARRYEAERGRALAVASIGFSLGETLFPPLVVLGLSLTDWRNLWPVMAVLAALSLLPFLSRLVRQTENLDGPGASLSINTAREIRHWTRTEMLRDPRFYLIALVPVAQAGLITGLFFHQVHIVSLKGWALDWWSLSFSAFAGFAFMGALTSGFLVDRFRARRVVPFILLPMTVAFILLAFFDNALFAPLIMAILGFGAGLMGPGLSALWPELYGTRHLGAIRSVATVVMVFGSALGPVFMGVALDAGTALQAIALTASCLALLSAGLATLALFRP